MSTINTPTGVPLFHPGQLVITSNALSRIQIQDIHPAFYRHIFGDWGEVCEEDKQINNDAIRFGERVLSAYTSSSGDKFWIITERDRSVTTILLPEDY